LAGTSDSARAVACDVPGEWPHTADAKWLARVLRASSYEQFGCTGSAFVIDTGGREVYGHDLYVWAFPNPAVPHPRTFVRTTVAGVAIWHDRLQGVWRAGTRNVWVEAGPTTRKLLPVTRLRRLIRATQTVR
jgi:hypothetical protein